MSVFLLDASLVRAEDEACCSHYLAQISSDEFLKPSSILKSIPRPPCPSYAPLATLLRLLHLHEPRNWPVLELQRTYAELWRYLPDEAKAGRAPASAQALLDETSQLCKQSYASLCDLYHATSDETAIIDPISRSFASHSDVARVVAQYPLQLDSTPGNRRPVIAISLPNGPVLALSVLASASYYTVASIEHGPGVGPEQFKADVLRTKASMVITSARDVERLGLRDTWLTAAGIDVVLVSISDGMSLEYRTLDQKVITRNSSHRLEPNAPDDITLLLFTSGTTGTKKIVPLTLHTIVCGAAMVIDSWGLTSTMRCVNQMPLNHVGGIVRNLFAPILSGSSVICCAGFDQNLFWDCVEDFAPTWYYASPSMHQCILDAAASRCEAVARSNIRLVCNAAGGLLPSLAKSLRDTFSHDDIECIVLPSYGMTECMPISTPALDYKLEPSGTSGISIGPDIAILNDHDEVLAAGDPGRICVRGQPVFDGYMGPTGAVDATSCKNKDGWFDTGDLGCLDCEGLLYITGRSKEVINRGGEIISPFEVEDAIIAASAKPESPIYGRVGKVLAFSVPHNVLQEVVGIAVTTPDGSLRADLRGICEAVKDNLSKAKTPVVIVYMDDGLPMNNNNKILRTRLAVRMQLPEATDSTPTAEHYYEAISPPPNTPLSVPIECHPVEVCLEPVQEVVEAVLPETVDVYTRPDSTDFYPEVIVAPRRESNVSLCDQDLPDITQVVAEDLHGYQIPQTVVTVPEPLPRDKLGQIKEDVLDEILVTKCSPSIFNENLSTTERTVRAAFAQVLEVREMQMDVSADFFALGGTSMAAGRLLAVLRSEFQLRLPINDLFTHHQIGSLSSKIDDRLRANKMLDAKDKVAESPLLPGCTTTYSSTNPLLMILQLLPIGLVYPMKRALTWTVFMYTLSLTLSWYTNHSIPGRLLNLVFSISVGKIVTGIIAPLFAIAFKWIVVGRYQEGLFPMWGGYHTRWWLTEKVVCICEKGVFDLFNWSRILYFRLLGAHIGSNVWIDCETIIGEWDLVSIGCNVVLDRCKVRPFAAERNTSMYLGKVTIGKDASIGLCSVVAGGTTIPPATCIGPNSSSWELSDTDESFRDLTASKIAASQWILKWFLELPLLALTTFVGMLPWLGCLVPLVLYKPSVDTSDGLVAAIIWFSSPIRVAFHYGALGANTLLGPFFFFLAALTIKTTLDLFYGKLTPGMLRNPSTVTIFRRNLYNTLLPIKRFTKLANLIGAHYEATSVLARLFGAKVGKRVYWPGSFVSVQDWDFVDIGDDVVFGSRSHIVTSDGMGSEYVHIGSGAMVADRVVLLPGTSVGENAVLGSGALTRRGGQYPAYSTWVGSKKGEAISLTSDSSTLVPRSEHGQTKRLSSSGSDATSAKDRYLVGSITRDVEKGHILSGDPHPETSEPGTESAQYQRDPDSSSPFGRAFYQGKAPYRVWTQFEVFLYSSTISVSCAVFWNASSISAVQVVGRLYRDNLPLTMGFLGAQYSWRPAALYVLFLAIMMVILAVQTVIVLMSNIAAKWILLGRRRPGNYDWDKSSYCQRWQLFLKIELFRRACYSGHGILALLTGTAWLSMYYRCLGADIGPHCALFAGGEPHLYFTEPDLLTLEERVSVDDASLVAHINTRGQFDLNTLFVGARSVLRANSRLLSGAQMEKDSCLLEHTLIMAGDRVVEGECEQGWPPDGLFDGERMPTLEVQKFWGVKSKKE